MVTVTRNGQPCTCCARGWINPPASWVFPTLEAAQRFAGRDRSATAAWATFTVQASTGAPGT